LSLNYLQAETHNHNLYFSPFCFALGFRPNDIHSLFQFLQVDTLKEKKYFKKHVVNPIKGTHEFGLALTRVTMGQITLRRTKDQVGHLVKLPTKTVMEHKFGFGDSIHGKTHDVLYEACRLAFQGLLRADNRVVFNNYYLVFQLALRVRQACCNGGLIPQEERELCKSFGDEFRGTDFDLLDKDEGIALFQKLVEHLGIRDNEGAGEREGESEPEECAICMEELIQESAMILRTCEHVFCQPVCHCLPSGCTSFSQNMYSYHRYD
jgi:SNF2 family DNA or RNA helicase